MALATSLRLQGTLCFRLNLNRGSLEVDQRAAVVARSYWPLLELLESRPWLSLALAASAHTLERLERLEPRWIQRLWQLCAERRAEFLGIGDSHLIGPLVPAAVNRWNQVLGREVCAELLGRAPRVALVNEFAWSQGLVDAYLDAGYEAVVLDWNRARRAHPEWREEWCRRRAWTSSPTGRRIQVLWSEAEFGRSLRHAASGGQPGECLAAFRALGGERKRHVVLQCGEAEALGAEGRRDWERLGALLDLLREEGLEFATPTDVLEDAELRPERVLELATGADPIPCAPESGEGVTRWALGGWNNLGVNAQCFARAQELERMGGAPRDWQLVCRAWAAGLRVDLTEARWKRLERSLSALAVPELSATAFQEAPLRSRLVERAGRRLAVGSDGVHVVLNLCRGLALDSLVLRHGGPDPLVGSAPVALAGALDWPTELYSGHAILDSPGAERITDLVPVEPEIEHFPQGVRVRASVPTALGALPKEVRVYAHRLEIRYGFSALTVRPRSGLRAGVLTLLDEALGDELWVSCAHGGPRERRRLEASAHAGTEGVVLGATDGWLTLDDGKLGLELSWPQAETPVLPILHYRLADPRQAGGRRIVQLGFLLGVVDVVGGSASTTLRDFRFSIRPWRKRR